jgi:site-specific DNA-methyltransferase (adenine-specific)
VPSEPAIPTGVFCSDSLALLGRLPDACVDLIYADPPFGTGKVQRLRSLRATAEPGEPEPGAAPTVARPDFAGRAAHYEITSAHAYRDDMPFEEYLAWLEANLVEFRRVLKDTGSLYLHLDWHAVHYAKVILDRLFGRANFRGEIIWAYDFGGRPRNAWPRKHDNILWYSKGDTWTFNRADMDRLPYLAPGLVGPEKAARGKLPTDAWFTTIVPTASRDRTGWPTQKPILILERIIKASSNPGELVLDPFVGSGTSAVAAQRLGRKYLVADFDPAAVAITEARLARATAGKPYRDSRPPSRRQG